jgi:hypothetical protein
MTLFGPGMCNCRRPIIFISQKSAVNGGMAHSVPVDYAGRCTRAHRLYIGLDASQPHIFAEICRNRVFAPMTPAKNQPSTRKCYFSFTFQLPFSSTTRFVPPCMGVPLKAMRTDPCVASDSRYENEKSSTLQSPWDFVMASL